MKSKITLALIALFAHGCVTGPEEMAAEKDKLKAKEEVSIAQMEDDLPMDDGKVTAASAETSVASADFKKTASGLGYKIIKEGTGKRPTGRSTVTCHYRGWLDDGTEFDSSIGGNPISFPLNGVIKGWTEGLQLIKEGGKIELDIPSNLGYGAAGSPGAIPPNARLHFEVELIKVR